MSEYLLILFTIDNDFPIIRNSSRNIKCLFLLLLRLSWNWIIDYWNILVWQKVSSFLIEFYQQLGLFSFPFSYYWIFTIIIISLWKCHFSFKHSMNYISLKSTASIIPLFSMTTKWFSNFAYLFIWQLFFFGSSGRLIIIINTDNTIQYSMID